jgi:cobalamin biosynthesis protein CbiD
MKSSYTLELFQEAINKWLLTCFDEDARQVQMRYIEHLKKPQNIEVSVFSDWLGVMISQAKRIPINDDITIMDMKCKMVVYDRMLYSWRSKFQLA